MKTLFYNFGYNKGVCWDHQMTRYVYQAYWYSVVFQHCTYCACWSKNAPISRDGVVYKFGSSRLFTDQ
jgi:hypothetical protein